MSLKIIKREDAKQDVIELADYIAHDSLEAAERFIDAAEAAFGFLAAMPDVGSRRELRDPELSGLRMWPIRGFEKHLIFYRQIPDGLEIVRVLHSARNIQAILGEE